MRLALYHGKGQIRLAGGERPVVQPGFVVIAVNRCGICGSDLHAYSGEWEQRPFAGGHELSGVIVEVGSGVTGLTVGDRVCVECFWHCGECRFCLGGRYNLCRHVTYLGSKTHGGFAEDLLAKATSVFKLPDQLDFAQGALVEPLAVAYRAWSRAQATQDDRLLIVGAGTIGLCVLMCAKAAGWRSVTITAKYPHQAAAARDFGADAVIMATEQKIEEALGEPADVTIETTASSRGIADALSATRPSGTVVLVGGYSVPLRTSLSQIVGRELQVRGSQCYGLTNGVRDFASAIGLIAQGKVPVARLVTHRFPFDQIAEAFATAADKQSGAIKVHVVVSED